MRWIPFAVSSFLRTFIVSPQRLATLASLWIYLVCGAPLACRGAAGAVPEPKESAEVLVQQMVTDCGYTLDRTQKTAGRMVRLKGATLLAYKAMVDDRPWYVDHAIVLAELSNGLWELWDVARNPILNGKPNPKDKWTFHEITDSTQRGRVAYKSRPTRADVEAFLKQNDFTLYQQKTGPGQWKLLSAKVYEESWQKTLGFNPTPKTTTPTKK